MPTAEGPDNSLPSSPRMVMAPTEDLASALRRNALEQVEIISCGFTPEDDDVMLDSNVHLARKAGKRLRALLRLCRGDLGDDVYRRENALVRDQGRRLSVVRASKVLVDTFDSLVEESVLPDRDTDAFRTMLTDCHAAAVAQLRSDTVGRAEAHAALAELSACIARLPAPSRYLERDLAAVQPAVVRSYRSARKAMRSARMLDSAHVFHEWRKRVNHLRYQMEALSGACAAPVGAMTETLNELTETLGGDHDLADLHQSCTVFPDLAPRGLSPLLSLRSSTLRERSLEIGDRLFVHKPSDFGRFFAVHARPPH